MTFMTNQKSKSSIIDLKGKIDLIFVILYLFSAHSIIDKH